MGEKTSRWAFPDFDRREVSETLADATIALSEMTGATTLTR